MNKITNKDLDYVVARINEITNHATEPYTIQDDKTFKPNAGNYHLDSAYGKIGLSQMCDTGTGTRTIFGYTTKRELYEKMQAFIAGLEAK